MPRSKITPTEARAAVRRLGALKGWPYETEAQDEYLRIAMTYSRDAAHLSRVITEIIDSGADCPRPHELRDRLQPRAAGPAYQNWVLPCAHGKAQGSPCSECPGGTADPGQPLTAAERAAWEREIAAAMKARAL